MLSSKRIVKKPKHSVSASGTAIRSRTRRTMDSSAATPRITKSRSPQSHRFAVALRFCGYKYCVIILSLHAKRTPQWRGVLSTLILFCFGRCIGRPEDQFISRADIPQIEFLLQFRNALDPVNEFSDLVQIDSLHHL